MQHTPCLVRRLLNVQVEAISPRPDFLKVSSTLNDTKDWLRASLSNKLKFRAGIGGGWGGARAGSGRRRLDAVRTDGRHHCGDGNAERLAGVSPLVRVGPLLLVETRTRRKVCEIF